MVNCSWKYKILRKMGMMMIEFIGAASGWGAQKNATEKGPEGFKDSNVLAKLTAEGYGVEWSATVEPKKSFTVHTVADKVERAELVLDHVRRLSDHVSASVRHEKFPVVIGGDHACAMGTWSGVISALSAEGDFGLIWIDAHMDAHTAETSPSMAYHGMPLAHLLGAGEDDYVRIGSDKVKLNPKHLCLIGIRSFEAGEKALLEEKGVRVFYMDEVEERGFDAVFKEAMAIANQANKGFGVSIDLDGFDPEEAPATGSLEKGGLWAKDVLPVLNQVTTHPKLKGLEIAEFNPTLSGKDKTLELMHQLLLNTLPKK